MDFTSNFGLWSSFSVKIKVNEKKLKASTAVLQNGGCMTERHPGPAIKLRPLPSHIHTSWQPSHEREKNRHHHTDKSVETEAGKEKTSLREQTPQRH